MSAVKSFTRLSTGRIRKLLYLIDMGKGRVGQPVIDRWEAELVEECAKLGPSPEEVKANLVSLRDRLGGGDVRSP